MTFVGTAGVAAAPAVARGRTHITARALEQVVTAVTGDALGVPAGRVDVTLTDHAGALDVVARAPIRVVSIERLRRAPGSLAHSGGSLLERCERAEQVIRSRVEALTGYSIRAVTIRVADVLISEEKRVR